MINDTTILKCTNSIFLLNEDFYIHFFHPTSFPVLLPINLRSYKSQCKSWTCTGTFPRDGRPRPLQAIIRVINNPPEVKTDFPFAPFPPSFCALHITEFTRQSHGALLRRDFSSAALPSLFTSPDICSLRNPNFFLCLLQTNLTCKTLPFLCAGGFCLLTEELPDSEHPTWCCESTAAYQTWKTTRKAKRKHHYCNLNTFLYFQMRFKHITRVFFRVCVFF